MNKKKIDIIIPSYNDARMIDAIESIFLQDKKNITRIIIVDGASSRELVAEIKAKLRITDIIVSEKDRGVFDALNKGLELCTAPYFGWLGADDIYIGTLIFDQLLSIFANEKQFDCVCFGTDFITNGKTTRRMNPPMMNAKLYQMGYHLPHFSSFWRRDFIGEKRFSLGRAADLEFFYKLIVNKKAKVYCTGTISTEMATGGQSNGSIKSIIQSNKEVFHYFRAQQGSLSASIAIFIKLMSKVLSVIRGKIIPF